ncbi:MAG TPA: flagellar hook assembly protein FlgD [Burkholderiales bacterium]|nr:flagellar hook assembly protein FlgD [Burkholderiales bacterium]
MTSPVSGTSSTSGSATSTTGAASAASIQTNFMNLLVAQLKNQDPLNPMDNSQMTAQLAQINTVQGIEQLNTTLQSLLGSYSDSTAMAASSLVGHGVLSSGNSLALASGVAGGGFNLASDADTVTITVTSASGQVVHQASLSDLKAGVQTFEWDGTTDAGTKAADGNYTFSVKATNAGQSVTSTPLKLSVVDGVSGGASTGTGTTLNTSSGSVSWSDVQQVL